MHFRNGNSQLIICQVFAWFLWSCETAFQVAESLIFKLIAKWRMAWKKL